MIVYDTDKVKGDKSSSDSAPSSRGDESDTMEKKGSPRMEKSGMMC